MDRLCFSVLCLLCLCVRLFICALQSPAGKGLTSPKISRLCLFQFKKSFKLTDLVTPYLTLIETYCLQRIRLAMP